jgi:hypothetical protein
MTFIKVYRIAYSFDHYSGNLPFGSSDAIVCLIRDTK